MHYSGLAYKQFLSQLRSTSPSDDDYQIKKADRSLSPRRPDYNRLYTAYCKEKYGGKNGSEMFDALDEIIGNYVAEHQDSIVQFQRYEEKHKENEAVSVQPFIVCILTPLMKRVHEMVRREYLFCLSEVYQSPCFWYSLSEYCHMPF